MATTKKRRKKPYEYGDELLAKLLKEISQLFRRRRLMDFDEINALSTSNAVTKLYKDIDRLTRKRLYELWSELYAIAYWEEEEDLEEEAWLFGRVEAQGYVDAFLRDVDPVMKCAYDTEMDRKRARLFEALVIDRQKKQRREIDNDYAKAERELQRFIRQFFIDVEDDAVIRGYKAAGVKEVMWMTQLDGRVCPDCDALDAKIFPIDDLPDKPHIGCRCYWKAVRR